MTETNNEVVITNTRVSTRAGWGSIATGLALAAACAACGGGSNRVDASPEDARPGPGIPDAAPGTPDARPPTGPDAAPITPMSDEFNGASLDSSWNLIRGELLDISVSGGELHLVANQYSVWFELEVGAALWKGVAGDFKATTSVKARKESNPSEFVGAEYQFGGLIAYNPQTTDQHNYVFVVVGDRRYYLAVETKSTTNSSSRVDGPEWPSGDAELRLCRVGSKFYLYKRAIGATSWIEAASYDRPDLPETLNVGPFAYAYTREPDLRASFAYVSIEPVSSANDCTVD
jgi:hypothetical protein